MTKRWIVLAQITIGAFALPFVASATEFSHNVGGERGFVFHDAPSVLLAAARAQWQTPSSRHRPLVGVTSAEKRCGFTRGAATAQIRNVSVQPTGHLLLASQSDR